MSRPMMRAGLWSSAESIFRVGMQFGVSIVVARILSPRDFGIYALTLIFSSLSGVLIDGGFSSALIQRQSTDQPTETAVFQYNLLMAAGLALLIAVAAPFVARGYGFPVLRNLLLASAVLVFVGSLGAVPAALMHRRLEFVSLSKINITSSVLGSVAGVLAAALGAGIWTFVTQSAVVVVGSTTAIWFVTDWRPRGPFDLRPARSLAGYGSFLTLSSLLEVAYLNGYPFILAKTYGVLDVAYFNRGQNIQANPSTVISATIQRLLFPVLAGNVENPAVVKAMTKRAVATAMAINAPIMVFLAIFSNLVIAVVYGAKWQPAGSVLTVLAVSGIVFPLQVINLQVLLAHGRSNTFFKLEIVKKILGIAFVVAGSFFGLMGISLGQALFLLIALGLNARPIATLIDYPLREQLRDSVPALGSSLVVMGLAWGLSTALPLPATAKLLALLFLGGSAYAGAAILFRIGPFREALAMVRNRQRRLVET